MKQLLVLFILTEVFSKKTVAVKTPYGTQGGAPRSITVVGVSPTSVRLQWNPPVGSPRVNYLPMFEVSVQKPNEQRVITVVATNQLNVVVRGLNADTNYIFRVRGFTELGPGPWSMRVPFRTARKSRGRVIRNVAVERLNAEVLNLQRDTSGGDEQPNRVRSYEEKDTEHELAQQLIRRV